jgi:NADH-quinone oxidoreductase subunit M
VLSLFSAYQPAGLNVGLYRTLMVFGGIGTVLTAGYILWTIQRVAMGTLSEERRMESIIDVSTTEWVAWAPLLAGIVVLGLVPKLITGATNDAVTALVRIFIR